MKYYRVLPQYDNRTLYKLNNYKKAVPAGIMIANELYTLKEYARFAMNPACFELVEISQKKIYWFFGARFEMKKQ